MAELRATPMVNPVMGLLADRLKKVQQFGAKPFGYENPPVEMLMNLLGVPAVQQTMERMAYGEPLTTGRGMTTKPRAEAVEAAMTLLPASAGLAKATKGLPVGASIKDVGTKLKVKPPTDDVYEVMDATFEFGKLGGNKTLPIDQLTGGVRMTDPKEAKRVQDLAEKISSPDGYVSRIIVDDSGNVLEGQHRLEALRLLGQKNVPVAVIQDLGNKYDIPAMKKALEGKFRSDEARQLLKHSIDTLEEAGSIDKALSDYAMPSRYQKPFEDAIKASKIKPSYPQQEALDTAQRNAALPIEEGGLGLPKDNTAMDRAKAMNFDIETYHGTNDPNISSIDISKSRPDVQYMQGFFTSDDPNVAGNYGDILMPFLQQKGTTVLDRRAARQAGLEVPAMDTIYDKEKNILVTNNPSNIRSRFAAFDPMRRNEPDILAGVLPLGLLADEEQRKKIYELMPSLLGQ